MVEKQPNLKSEWEALLEILPHEIKRLEEAMHKNISEWEKRSSSQILWEELDDVCCSTTWELRYNSYEKIEELVSHYYESSDGRRGGYARERVIREKMPGSYWVNPKDPHKEYFVSRASNPDGPIPPVQYPHCTIAGGEENLWDKFSYPNDKSRVEALIQQKERDREYYRSRAEEAKKALAGSSQEKIKYLLTSRDGDSLRNKLKKAWALLNPGKPESLFWEHVIQSL